MLKPAVAGALVCKAKIALLTLQALGRVVRKVDSQSQGPGFEPEFT